MRISFACGGGDEDGGDAALTRNSHLQAVSLLSRYELEPVRPSHIALVRPL